MGTACLRSAFSWLMPDKKEIPICQYISFAAHTQVTVLNYTVTPHEMQSIIRQESGTSPQNPRKCFKSKSYTSMGLQIAEPLSTQTIISGRYSTSREVSSEIRIYYDNIEHVDFPKQGPWIGSHPAIPFANATYSHMVKAESQEGWYLSSLKMLAVVVARPA